MGISSYLNGKLRRKKRSGSETNAAGSKKLAASVGFGSVAAREYIGRASPDTESNRNPNPNRRIGIGLKLAQKPIYRCLCLFWLPLLLIAVLLLLLQHEVATQRSWVLFILSADSLAKTDGLQKLNNCLR